MPLRNQCCRLPAALQCWVVSRGRKSDVHRDHSGHSIGGWLQRRSADVPRHALLPEVLQTRIHATRRKPQRRVRPVPHFTRRRTASSERRPPHARAARQERSSREDRRQSYGYGGCQAVGGRSLPRRLIRLVHDELPSGPAQWPAGASGLPLSRRAARARRLGIARTGGTGDGRSRTMGGSGNARHLSAPRPRP